MTISFTFYGCHHGLYWDHWAQERQQREQTEEGSRHGAVVQMRHEEGPWNQYRSDEERSCSIWNVFQRKIQLDLLRYQEWGMRETEVKDDCRIHLKSERTGILFMKQKQSRRCRNQIYGYQGGRGVVGRIERLRLTYIHYDPVYNMENQ